MNTVPSDTRLSFRRVEQTSVGIADELTADERKDNVIQFYSESRPKPPSDTEHIPDGLTALYVRLSQEDRYNTDGESNSISNQKQMLEKYCREHGYAGTRVYEDDGYSGTNFDRPGFQDMLSDVKEGRIARVVVKDMSRLGRDYLQAGLFTDILFPQLGVHFIAVGDGVDSKRGENEFTAIRNIFNEMYARDTSKKIKSVVHAKGKAGGRLTVKAPYGYVKDPENKNRWIVDEEAAAVVQKIFSLCAGGMGPRKIAAWLREHKVLCPSAYAVSKGKKAKITPGNSPYHWTTETVSAMLERLEYIGYMVNFKTSKPSYKSKKKVLNDPNEWVMFEGKQEPIIEESVFYIVQNIRKDHQKRRPTKFGEPPMFSGIAYCGDCGKKMYQQRYAVDKRSECLMCSSYTTSYSRGSGKRCSTHYIRVVVLEEIVLKNLREAIACVSCHEDEFVRIATENEMQGRQGDIVKQKEILLQAETRVAEVDGIIRNLYEDNLNGKISDARFMKLSRDYEREQEMLNANVEDIRKDLKAHERSRTGAKDFVAATKKYTEMKELDATVLREFIERIEVFQIDKETKTQRVKIVYNFIGAFDFEGFERAMTHPKRTENQTSKLKAV
jgi:DNA invertase Pin-like site-specific DNA recombinase